MICRRCDKEFTLMGLANIKVLWLHPDGQEEDVALCGSCRRKIVKFIKNYTREVDDEYIYVPEDDVELQKVDGEFLYKVRMKRNEM